MLTQEMIALGIVALAVMSIVVKGFRSLLVAPFSQWLLKRGYVKNAIRMRALMPKKSGCNHCKS